MIGLDIQRQIDIHKARLETYNIEKEYLLKQMMGGPQEYKSIDYSGMPHGNGAKTVTLDRSWEDMRKLQNMIDLEEWAIEALEKQLKNMRTSIDDLKGIDLKVKYLRDIEGLPLQLIADKLKYSLDYIKEVSCRNSRKPTINPLTSTILCDIMLK